MYTPVLAIFFFLHFYFILTNAQTFLPQIILGQVTSRKAVCILYLTKREWGEKGRVLIKYLGCGFEVGLLS